MKCKINYVFTWTHGIPDEIRKGFTIKVAGIKLEVLELDGEAQSGQASAEMNIDPSKLALSEKSETMSGIEIPPALIVEEELEISYGTSRIADLLAFATDKPLRLSRSMRGDEVVPESAGDKELLEGFGATNVFQATSLRLTMRTFNLSEINNDENLAKLANKETGLAIYASALSEPDSPGKFRSFWLVLEAAFASKDDGLVTRIADFRPAEKLGFTQQELKALLILRDRASHAMSKAGMKELRHVERETREKLARLKCLVEQVILTKKSWGAPSCGVERLAEITSYIDASGSPTIKKT